MKWIIPVIITIVLIGFAFFCYPLPDALVSHISMFISAIAFTWLIFGYYLQKEAIDLQRTEIAKGSKFQAFQQMRSMIESFNDYLRSNTEITVKHPSELPGLFTKSVPLWLEITENPSRSERTWWDAMKKWSAIKALCNEYLGTYASAVRAYCQSIDKPVKDFPDELRPFVEKYKGDMSSGIDKIKDALLSTQFVDLPSAWFIKLNASVLKELPLAESYSHSAQTLADLIIQYQPGINRVELAILERMEKEFPGVVKQDALKKLRELVREHDEFVDNKKQQAETTS
ncbi:MAG TPA: hypothetical protein PKH37_09150 [Alphaproteobacteria bacterium]|nr:hypothetical protein [Alphaproteobacteria bacterium]